MKILKRISILFIALCFICNKTIAQIQALTIESSTVPIDNVSILDSLLVGNGGTTKNQVFHRVDFEIVIRKGSDFLKVITELQASLINNKLLTPEFYLPVSVGGRTSVDFINGSKRIYKNAVVRKIVLEELNTSLRNYAKIIVTIEAASIEVQENATLNFGEKNMERALGSNYRIRVGSLPCDRIAKISGIEIGSQPKLQTISVQLSGVDEKAWNVQFNNGADKIITEGSLEILSADLKTVILTINLKNMSIISYKAKISSEQTTKTIFELKMGSVLIDTKTGK